MNYESEVKKVHPNAVAKHWAYDNGHGDSSFWSIAKENVGVNYDPDQYLSGRCPTKKSAWKSAYDRLNIPNTVS